MFVIWRNTQCENVCTDERAILSYFNLFWKVAILPAVKYEFSSSCTTKSIGFGYLIHLSFSVGVSRESYSDVVMFQMLYEKFNIRFKSTRQVLSEGLSSLQIPCTVFRAASGAVLRER
jgi:hypothetical protein